MNDIMVAAPFAAWVSPLTEVPDEAFSSGLLGEGVGLEPLEGTLRAPFDCEIVSVASTGHSITLRHCEGAELLVHLGIDTVALNGEGFHPAVSAGQNAKTGDVLLRFDLDNVACNARSAMTPLVLLDDRFQFVEIARNCRVSSGEAIGMLRRTAEQNPGGDLQAGAATREIRVALPNGVHARPAARIAALVKRLGVNVEISIGERVGDARSVASLLKLDVRFGDEIKLIATGREANAALDALVDLFDHGLAEAPHHTSPASDPASIPDAGSKHERTVIRAVRAAPGGAAGAAVQLSAQDLTIPEGTAGSLEERALLEGAVAKLSGRLHSLSGQTDIAEAHLAILSDPLLWEAATRRIAGGSNAAAAWRETLREEEAALASSGNALLAERAADFRDVERQLIAILLGVEARRIALPDHSIVLADDLLPSAFLELDLDKVAGIATVRGGATSHVAILAASRGVPMLVSCGPVLLDVDDGTPLLLEATEPVLHITPSADARARFEAEATARAARNIAETAAASADCFTADGKRIEVFANCGSVEDARSAAAVGAEGFGLVRTEFLFLGRADAPTAAEQIETYAGIAAALPDRPIIMRSLDAGSDKRLAFLPQGLEENPALGLRGIRLSLANPDLLAEQFRAILKGVPSSQRRIMLPMVSDLSEFRAARALLRSAEQELAISQPTPLGIMVETPAAAVLADQLASEADFLSVGSNDLTQYVLAADRQNALVSGGTDTLHPAVLRLIRIAAQGAHAHGRWLGVCGGIASDPVATEVLVGLGVDELSVSPPMVPAIKARVRTLNVDACDQLATAALLETTAADVRRLLQGVSHAPAL